MKPFHLLSAAAALLVVGFFTGKQSAPSPPDPDPSTSPVTSDRNSQRTIRERTAAPSGDVTASPTDLNGLLKLVDPTLAFETETRLRAALGDLGPATLEDLLTRLLELEETKPGYYPLRMSLINHLASVDPFRALDFVLAHKNKNFKNHSIALVVQAASRVDLAAARATVAQIDDPLLKGYAKNALLNAPDDASVEELLARLKDHTQTPTSYGHHYGFGGSIMPIFYPQQSNGVLGKLALKDLGAAEAYAGKLETKQERINAFSQIAGALAQEDPAAALEWAKAIPTNEGRDQHISAVINAMAAKDPSQAAALISEISNFQNQANAISGIAGYWAQKDPHAAIAWLDTLPAGQARANAYQNAVYQLGQSDPLSALGMIDRISGSYRQNSVSNILSQWAARDFDAARKWITSEENPITLNAAFPSMIQTWAQKDPAGAAQFLSESPLSANKYSQYQTLAFRWASHDQGAALDWAHSIENKQERSSALQGVYQQWGQADPEGASQHLASVTDDSERRKLLTSISTQWINQDFDAARSWLQSLPTEDRIKAASSAISNLSYQQPNQAAALLDQLISAGNDEQQIKQLSNQASSIVSYWAEHDPAAAAEWAAHIANENDQSSAYQSLANQWIQHDPTAASQWIDNLPVGKARDQATTALVENVRYVDPASAFDWAETIGDDKSRFNQLRSALDHWKSSDPEAARQAAAQVNVTDEQREQLLNRLK